MNIDLTPFFQAVIALLAALITYKLIPWIRARTTESQQATIRALVRTLVFAAEQIYGEGNGKDKLAYVESALANAGFDVDTDEIEAAVWEYLNSGYALGDMTITDDDLTDEDEDTETSTEAGAEENSEA